MVNSNKEFFRALDLLEKEKGIPKDYMIEKVEAALLTAFKRETGFTNMKVVLDSEKQNIKIYKLLTVVDPEEMVRADKIDVDSYPNFEDDEYAVEEDEDFEPIMTKRGFNPKTEIPLEEAQKIKASYSVGDVVETEIKPKNFKRIPAQTAKQVIIQGIREAERKIMIKEYESKKEELVTATVTRIDPVTGNVTLEIGKNEVVLFKNEQIPGEKFTEGQLIKVYVLEVKKESVGPAVVFSRTHPGLVKRLFELEVPEIQDGTVIIKSIAREAGSRTKIAVCSRDENVDAIGSCIGPKNMRKNKIISEINGEKIDIIRYSDIPEDFIKEALSPANILSVIKTGERSYKAIVSDEQLSLAIGMKGQNARLAARLTGFKIDIKSSSDSKQDVLNSIFEGKDEPSTSFGGKLAEALKKAAEKSDSSED